MRLRSLSAALDAVTGLVVELGGDPASLRSAVERSDGAGFAPHAFQVALGRAAVLTGREDFGLALARRRTLETFGELGPLLGSAASVGEAVGQLLQLLPYLQEGGVRARIERHGLEAILIGQVVLSDPPAFDQQLDHLAAAAVGLLRGLTSPDWTPDAVYLTRRRPRSTTAHEAFFGAPVLFGQETTAVAFRAGLLDRPVARANLELNRILYARLSERTRLAGDGLAEQVRDRIWRGLGDRWRGEAGVAADLGMPLRTLQRRLAGEGRPFRRLLEETRLELAQRLMRHSDLPLSDIAAALGYAEPAIFTRFFRRCAGRTPGDWRRQTTSFENAKRPGDEAGALRSSIRSRASAARGS